MKTIQDLSAAKRDPEVARGVLEYGPIDLSAIEVSSEEMRFSSFDEDAHYCFSSLATI